MPTVRFAIDASLGYAQEILAGAYSYANDRDWDVRYDWQAQYGQRVLSEDAFIVMGSRDLCGKVARTGCPFVNLNWDSADIMPPPVTIDDYEVGILAGRHLKNSGWRRFAAVTVDARYASERSRGFADALGIERDALPSHAMGWREFGTASIDPDEDSDQRFLAWLNGLEKPIAILACDDVVGWRLARACLKAGISVPRGIGILSVNDDPYICAISPPGISSIKLPFQRMGAIAAERLDRLLTGNRLPPDPTKLKPLGITERASARFFSVDDPLVADALAFIAERANATLPVLSVAQHTGLSRSQLDRRFRDALGTTPHDEINRVHIEAAKTLLADMRIPLESVAKRSGLRSAWTLNRLFKEVVGMTPTRYRANLGTNLGD